MIHITHQTEEGFTRNEWEYESQDEQKLDREYASLGGQLFRISCYSLLAIQGVGSIVGIIISAVNRLWSYLGLFIGTFLGAIPVALFIYAISKTVDERIYYLTHQKKQ